MQLSYRTYVPSRNRPAALCTNTVPLSSLFTGRLQVKGSRTPARACLDSQPKSWARRRQVSRITRYGSRVLPGAGLLSQGGCRAGAELAAHDSSARRPTVPFYILLLSRFVHGDCFPGLCLLSGQRVLWE